MNFVISTIRGKFPGVQGIDTDQAKGIILENKDEKVMIIDTRRQDEFEVSRIPGAIHLDLKCSDQELNEVLANVEDNTKIINYCSLGYRSAMMTQRISNQLDNIQVFNLEGSIFKWANEDKPLVNHRNEPTKNVHPFAYRFAIPTLSWSKWKWTKDE